jgi:ABC-type Mn2+/Zn2+ transport system permease subunit
MSVMNLPLIIVLETIRDVDFLRVEILLLITVLERAMMAAVGVLVFEAVEVLPSVLARELVVELRKVTDFGSVLLRYLCYALVAQRRLI